MDRRMHLSLLFLVLAMTTVILTFGTESAESRPALDDVANMAETLRYLEQLDKYYSQMARPRYGRSVRDGIRSSAAGSESKDVLDASRRR